MDQNQKLQKWVNFKVLNNSNLVNMSRDVILYIESRKVKLSNDIDMQKKKTFFFLIDLQHWEFTGPNILKSRWRVTFSLFFSSNFLIIS